MSVNPHGSSAIVIEDSDDDEAGSRVRAPPSSRRKREIERLAPWSGWKPPKRPKNKHDESAAQARNSSLAAGPSTDGGSGAQMQPPPSSRASGKQPVRSTSKEPASTAAQPSGLLNGLLPPAVVSEFAGLHNAVAKAMREQSTLVATLQEELKKKDEELENFAQRHDAVLLRYADERRASANRAAQYGQQLANLQAHHEQELANAVDEAARQRQALAQLEEEVGYCVVCHDNRRTWCWDTCGHLLLCNDCHANPPARNSGHGRCMICRQAGEGFFRVRY